MRARAPAVSDPVHLSCAPTRLCDCDDDSKPVNQYIQDLETDMQNARRYAHLHANAAQQQYTEQYNKHAKDVISSRTASGSA